MHHVDLVLRQHVDLLLHFFNREEMAAGIHMEAAPPEPRVIDYLHAGNLAVGLHQLAECLLCVEDAGLVGRGDIHAPARNGQGVALRRYAGSGVYGAVNAVLAALHVKTAILNLYGYGFRDDIDHCGCKQRQ